MTDTITGTLTWLCDVCGKPVTGTTGYICVDVNAAHESRQAVKEWKERHPPGTVLSGSELFTYPSSAPWHVYHRRCDPLTASANDYWFGVERARTERRLLDWTAHLLGKDWFVDTNWSALIYRALSGRCDS